MTQPIKMSKKPPAFNNNYTLNPAYIKQYSNSSKFKKKNKIKRMFKINIIPRSFGLTITFVNKVINTCFVPFSFISISFN